MRKNFTKTLSMFAILCAAFNITQGANTSNILDNTPPANFRIGFGSSSEIGIDIHLLRALKLAIPYAAVAHDDVFSVCKNNSATFNPLFNDTVYTGLITAPAPATANTAGVGNTFQFVDAAGLVLGTSSYTETGVGTWTFIPSTRIVTFTPELDFTGTATIKYNIKGTTAPYNTEAYRSDPGTITAIIKTNCDSDNDNIINDADLDDDNDGILDTVEGQCTTPTRTTTWTATTGAFPGSATATGTTALGNVTFTSAPITSSGTSITFGGANPVTGAFNTTNFWYTTTPSNLSSKPSLQFVQAWDTSPASSTMEPANVDGGTRLVIITFPTPVNKVLLNIDRLGGTASLNTGITPFFSNSMEFTMTTLNMVMSKLAGNPQFIVTPTKFYRDPDVNLGYASPGPDANNTTGTAAGTVEFKKNDGSSFTSITFTTTGVGPEGPTGDDGIEMIFEFCKDRDTDLDGLPDYLDLDSDGDGCADATEGGAGFALANLVDSSMPGGNSGAGYTGTSTSPIIQNLCATAYTGTATDCVGSTGIPLIVNQTIGQTVGTSTDGAVKATVCSLCYKPGVLEASSTFPTKHGITALGRAGAENENWPMTRESAWTVLESKEKGFVVNRVALTIDLANISNPVEGMMVYDEEADCLKIYTLKYGDSVMGWHCFTTPACPD